MFEKNVLRQRWYYAVTQAGFELMTVLLPQLLSAGITDMNHYA